MKAALQSLKPVPRRNRFTGSMEVTDTVLAAIKDGFSRPEHIALHLDIDLDDVRNAIKRLNQKGLVRRNNQGGYESAHNKGHLGEVW